MKEIKKIEIKISEEYLSKKIEYEIQTECNDTNVSDNNECYIKNKKVTKIVDYKAKDNIVNELLKIIEKIDKIKGA